MKIDTQGMSGKGSSPFLKDAALEVGPFPEVKHNIFSDEEREELKKIIREVLLELL